MLFGLLQESMHKLQLRGYNERMQSFIRNTKIWWKVTSKLQERQKLFKEDQKRKNKIIIGAVIITALILLCILFLILEGMSSRSSEGKTEEIKRGDVLPMYPSQPVENQDISYGNDNHSAYIAENGTISGLMISWFDNMPGFGIMTIMMIAVGVGIFLSFFKSLKRYI